MGVVYTAMHPGLGLPVALKVLADSYSNDESFRARFQREASTVPGAMVGTPACMAPEQVKGDSLDQRADIYALGCMFYELLHGEPPFTGSMPNVLHSQVFSQPRPSTAIPEHLFHIVAKAMAKEPKDRFQSCEEFAGALLQATRPDLNKPSTPPPDAPPAQTAHTLRNLLDAALTKVPALSPARGGRAA